MSVLMVARWKGNLDDLRAFVNEVAPILKEHGATTVRCGQHFAGPTAGDLNTVVTFPDMATLGTSVDAVSANPTFRNVLQNYTTTGKLTLQARSIVRMDD